MSSDDESITAQLKPRYQLQSNTIIWADLFELTIFMTVPSNVYNATVIQYNSYQEFRFKLHYINGTL
jgi:hypothetical protein